MSRRRIAVAALAAWIAGQGGAHAASAGGDSLDFLSLDAGARPAAMGGAHAAVASGAAALHYNPAGLARTTRHEAAFMHHQYIEGASQEHAAVALTQGFGASLQYLGWGRQQRTTVSKPDGSGLGAYGMSDTALTVGYGRPVGRLDLGAAAKYVRESIDNVVASGVLFDLGARYEIGLLPGASLGAVASNLGPSIRYQREREAAPLSVRVGGAYSRRFSRHRLLVAADIVKSRTDGPRPGFGTEVMWSEKIAFRLGYNGLQDSGPGIAVGAGYAMRDISVDYAFAPYGGLGFGHRMSLTWRWGDDAAGDPTVSEAEDAPAAVEAVESVIAGAESDLDSGRHARARIRLDSLAARIESGHPFRVRYHSARGRAFLLADIDRSAKEQFAEALRLAVARKERGPAVVHAYFGMGMCLERDGNQVYALKFMRKALEMDPAPKLRKSILDRLKAIEAASQPLVP